MLLLRALIVSSCALPIGQISAQWAFSQGRISTSQSAEEGIGDMVINSLGHVIISGFTSSDVAFPPYQIDMDGAVSDFVVEYDAEGNVQSAMKLWTSYLGAPGYPWINGLALDATDNLILGGDYNGDSLMWEDELILLNLGSGFTRSGYVTKLDAQGEPLWAVHFDHALVQDVDVFTNGDVLAVGYDQYQRPMVVKLASLDGSILWQRNGNTGTGVISDVSVDELDRVHFSGVCTETFTLDGVLWCPFETVLGTSPSCWYTAVMNGNGSGEWYHVPDQDGGPWWGSGALVEATSDGGQYVVTNNLVRFGSDTIAGGEHAGIYRLNADGTLDWARKMNSGSGLLAGSLTVDAQGAALVGAGAWGSSLDLTEVLLPLDILGTNIIIARYDEDGALTGSCVGPVISYGNCSVPAIAVDAQDMPVIGGRVTPWTGPPITMVFGSDSLVGDFANVFVAWTSAVALSAQDLEESDGLVIGPNPTRSLISIRRNGGGVIGAVELMDGTGRIVMSGSSTGNIATFDVSSLRAGIYFVRVSEHGSAQYMRILVGI
ncbi:MAG: T9SS type A sorting domain-containing protein [Flavobacteriales bacterium]